MTPDLEFLSSIRELFNKIGSPEQEEVQLVLRGGFPHIKSLDLYIPENLDVDKLLLEHPPEKKLKRDRLIYILHLFFLLQSRKKKNVSEINSFTHISRRVLGKTIKNYKDYLEYLIEHGIIEESSNYVVGVHSKGVRFTSRYSKPILPVSISDWPLIKNILYLRRHYDFSATQDLIFLKRWLLGIQVDMRSLIQSLADLFASEIESGSGYPVIAFNSRFLPALQLYKKEMPLFFVDNTSGRLHTNLTQLKSSLRKHLKYEGKTLVSIDLCNSQPYLLQTLLDSEVYLRCRMDKKIESVQYQNITDGLENLIDSLSKKDDVALFKEIVSSGQFYESFGELLLKEGFSIPEENEIRDFVKDVTFSALFSKNSHIRFNPAIKVFRKFFPNVYRIMEEVKKVYHPTLAVALQKLESELFLQKCCRKIAEEHPEIPIFTLHDSLITTEENIEYVKSIISQELKQAIGVDPKLKIERWE